MIKIKDLCKVIDNKFILNNINLEIKKGETTVIIGPSGSGKSTLLRTINLLETPTSGKIFVDDEEITSSQADMNLLRQKVGMVFQHFNLFNNMNAINNVILAPRKLHKESKFKSIKRALDLLKMVNLGDKARNMPHTLSGGQKQRLAIARALAMNPEYILFDEPTSALDPEMVQDVLNVIRDISRFTTSIIVSHEMAFVKKIATSIVFMEDGKILKHLPTEEFFNSSHDNPRISDFLRKIDRFE